MAITKARHYRVFDPNLYHEVTQRIRGGKFLLDPNCPLLKAAIYGQLATSLQRYKVKLLALHFMTDHFHAMYGTECPYNFSKFLAHFHSGLTRSYNRLRAAASPGVEVERVSLWHEMRWAPVATDERTIRWRLGYIMGQAVAAGLVDHPIQFPGASTVDAMVDGTPLMGKTYDATSKYRDSRLQAGAEPDAAYVEELEVKVTPPSCWEHLSPGELRQRYIEVVDATARVPLAELRGDSLKKEVPVEATAGREDPYADPADSPAVACAADPQELSPNAAAGGAPTANRSSDLEGPGLCQPHELTTDFTSSRGKSQKVHIPPRLDDFGQPYAAGPAKPKPNYYTADGKLKKRPLILAWSESVREAYEAAYDQWVEDYLTAKEVYRKGLTVTPAGLSTPGLAIPPNMMLGSMPYPKT